MRKYFFLALIVLLGAIKSYSQEFFEYDYIAVLGRVEVLCTLTRRSYELVSKGKECNANIVSFPKQ